jgi:hypothetical protein
MTLATEIGLVKTEIASSLAASLYTAKDLVYVAKAIEALANAETTTGEFNTVDVSSILYVGPNADTFNTAAGLTNPVIIAQSNYNDYSQIAFKNTNSGSNASTDFIAYSNNGTDSDGYIDMGITSQNFADPDFTITGKGDGYIFMVGATGGTDQGNLVFATSDTGSQNKIIFAAGGLASDNEQMSITPDQNVHIEIPTPSTSPSTGALTVVGGVGISGDVNINGSITFGGASSSLETTTLAVADPLIFVGNENRTDSLDLGLIAEYASSTATITKAVSNKALTSNVATLTTSTTHGFEVGDIVVVGSVDATFNGTYVVKAVPTTTTFTYDKTNANVTSAAVSPAGSAEVTTKRRFAGAIRDASDGVFKIFKDATTKPTNTINFAEGGLSFADMRVAALTASSASLTSAVIGNVDNTEIQYLNGVTSAIQTQIDLKAALAGPTFTGTVVLPSTTSIGDVDGTEIGYLNGVSSSIQTQLDAKLSSSTANSTYAPLLQTSDATKTFTSNNYTLVSGDKDKILLLSNSSTAGTVTIPSGVFAAGAVLTVVQTGSGQLTFTASGTTLNSQGGKLKLNGQYASAQIICTASNTFLLVGNLVA